MWVLNKQTYSDGLVEKREKCVKSSLYFCFHQDNANLILQF